MALLAFLLTLTAASIILAGILAYHNTPEKVHDVAMVYGVVKEQETTRFRNQAAYATIVATSVTVTLLALWGAGTVVYLLTGMVTS